jgi:hypothetical protein
MGVGIDCDDNSRRQMQNVRGNSADDRLGATLARTPLTKMDDPDAPVVPAKRTARYGTHPQRPVRRQSDAAEASLRSIESDQDRILIR